LQEKNPYVGSGNGLFFAPATALKKALPVFFYRCTAMEEHFI